MLEKHFMLSSCFMWSTREGYREHAELWLYGMRLFIDICHNLHCCVCTIQDLISISVSDERVFNMAM